KFRDSARVLSMKRNRTVVVSRVELFREKLFVLHPSMGLLEHLPRIGLEDQALPRPESADIDHPMIFLGYLFEKVMLVALGLQVDIAVRALQSPEVAFDVFDIGVRMQQKADHKCRVENFSESLLFNQVKRRAKHVCGIDLAVQQRRQAVLWLTDKA